MARVTSTTLRLGSGLRSVRARPLEVALGAVGVAQLVVALLDPRLLVDVARLQLEERADQLRLEDGHALELHLADPVLVALGDRDLEADAA